MLRSQSPLTPVRQKPAGHVRHVHAQTRRFLSATHAAGAQRSHRSLARAAATTSDFVLEPAPSNDEIKKIEEELEVIKEIDDWAARMKLRTGSKQAIVVSDLLSADPADPTATLQWVNLVMAGGGMLGIAHVGFVRVLEQAGVRFLGLGGASAGAINAALIAAVRERPDRVSWEQTRNILLSAKFDKFEDGDDWFKTVRTALSKWSVFEGLARAVKHHKSVRGALDAKGMHKGEYFHKWMAAVMAEQGVKKTGQLLDRMKLNVGEDGGIQLYRRDREGKYVKVGRDLVEPWTSGEAEHRRHYPLRLVASEVVTQTMAVFPRDADLYYLSANSAPPADFVRASMSVPIFFQPFCIPYGQPGDGSVAFVKDSGQSSETWKQRYDFEVQVPDQAFFCDGGTLSNFPMRLFLENQPRVQGAALLPTLGVRFNQDRSDIGPVKSTLGYLGNMFDTSRNQMDREFLFKNPIHKNWVATINTRNFDWLGFDVPQDKQLELMLRGMVAARDFLMSKRKSFEQGAPLPPGAVKPAASSDAAAASSGAAATAAPSSDEPVPLGMSAWDKYKIMQRLVDALEQADDNEIWPAVRTMLLQDLNLQDRFEKEVRPAMKLLRRVQGQLGNKWAWGVFLPEFNKKLREEVLVAREVTQAFWRDVQLAYKPKENQLQVITPDWWTDNWIGRGQEYRLLVEPLDIGNYYYINNHKKSGHYIDYKDKGDVIKVIGESPEEETAVDNNRRPGRYLMLQTLERDAEDQDKFGPAHMESSLGTARKLKEWVGNHLTWDEFTETL